MIFLEKIFGLLNDNKKFPYYQAERRIDIFINFFIEEIIRQHTCFTDAIYVAAEFPLKKGPSTDHAAHIDYLMVSHMFKSVLLVELKTDDGTYKTKQIVPYLKYENFKQWHDEFDTIKMTGFKDKKETLKNVIKNRLGDNFEDYKTKVVVLKPTLSKKDYHTLENRRDIINFIQLKDLSITTEHQEEWEIFRKSILCNF